MDKMKNVCWAVVLMVVVSGGWAAIEGGEPIPGMISYWTFDEGSGDMAYDSFGDNDGAVLGTEWTAGQIDGALEFDGTCHVNCGKDSSLDIIDSMTICIWVNPDDSEGGNRRFISRGFYNNSSNTDSMMLWYRNDLGEFGYRVRHNANEKLISAPGSPGLWQHITATYDSGKMELYINGEYAGSATSADLRPVVSEYDFIIGANIAPHPPDQSFDGKLDDIAIFNRALTPEEIERIYQDGLAGLGYELDYLQVAINKIEGAIDTKTEALELVDLAIEKEREAFLALDELRDSGELEDLSLVDIFKAKLEILWAMGRQIHAKHNLNRSIRRLEKALDKLTMEPEPDHGPPPHPERPVRLRGRW